MLKILMDAIEKIEKEHEDPHESSFWPYVEEDHTMNGTIESSSNDSAEPTALQSRVQTTSTLTTLRNGFKRRTNELVPPNSNTPSECGKYEGYLPCHYFDYIAGTSTGG